MTHKEETYVLDTLIEIQDFIRNLTFKQLVKETYKNKLWQRIGIGMMIPYSMVGEFKLKLKIFR